MLNTTLGFSEIILIITLIIVALTAIGLGARWTGGLHGLPQRLRTAFWLRKGNAHLQPNPLMICSYGGSEWP